VWENIIHILLGTFTLTASNCTKLCKTEVYVIITELYRRLRVAKCFDSRTCVVVSDKIIKDYT